MRVLNVAAIVTVAMTLGACGKSQRKVPESFAISLVQTQTTGLLSDAGTGWSRLLSTHPSAVASNSPTTYWLENAQSLTAPDSRSAEVHLREPIKLTRSQCEQPIQRSGGNVPAATSLTYCDHPKHHP